MYFFAYDFDIYVFKNIHHVFLVGKKIYACEAYCIAESMETTFVFAWLGRFQKKYGVSKKYGVFSEESAKSKETTFDLALPARFFKKTWRFHKIWHFLGRKHTKSKETTFGLALLRRFPKNMAFSHRKRRIQGNNIWLASLEGFPKNQCSRARPFTRRVNATQWQAV